MGIFNLYFKINRDFGDKQEIVSKNYGCDFEDHLNAIKQGKIIFKELKNETLETRKRNELHYHNFLKHQLFSRLQETKYYSDVDVTNTRRLVAVSQDCISSIQILIRDAIHINTYFRSSDFDGAWPADVEFLCTLPNELIKHLEAFKGSPGYEEVDSELINKLKEMPIRLNLSFGSIHRT